MKHSSPFRKWFEQQFGKRPKAMGIEDVASLEREAAYQRSQSRLRVLWDEKLTAAFYAWNASSRK